MNTRMTLLTLSLAVAQVGLLIGCGASRQSSYVEAAKTSAPPAAAAEADIAARALAAWSARDDGAKLKEALALYEKIAANSGTRATYSRLSRGHYLLAAGHLKKEEDILAAHHKGAGYGERILGLRPEFLTCIKDSKDYECLNVCKKEDVPGIYWAYGNLGKWSVLKGFTTVVKNKSKLKAFVDAAAKLDPTFYHGAPDRGLGAYYAKAPSFAGGDLVKSKIHFDKSLALAPNYLGTKVLMAEYWTVKKQDRKLFEKLLKEVIAADPNIVPDIAPIQKIEQRKAKKLLTQAEELFE